MKDVVKGITSQSIHTEKIVLNHYRIKSKEEYIQKGKRGCASDLGDVYTKKIFDDYDLNDEFDDDILKYRETRMQNFQMPDKFRATERLLNALTVNLSPTFMPNTPSDFYQGKMETFLTCRAVSSILKTILPDNTPAKFFEEASLKAILQSFVGMNLSEARLFIRELPNLLNLPYPVVKDIRLAAIKIIPQMINTFRLNYMFRDYVEFGYLQDLLKLEE